MRTISKKTRLTKRKIFEKAFVANINEDKNIQNIKAMKASKLPVLDKRVS